MVYVPTNEGDQEMQSNCAQEEDIWRSSSSLRHTQEANKSSLANNIEGQYGRTMSNKTGNLAQGYIVGDFD